MRNLDYGFPTRNKGTHKDFVQAIQSIFVAGWRPFVGWMCGVGLAYQAILHNLLEWLSGIYGFPVPPAPDSDVLVYVLGGLLGLGALRTYEKKAKVTKQ